MIQFRPPQTDSFDASERNGTWARQGLFGIPTLEKPAHAKLVTSHQPAR